MNHIGSGKPFRQAVPASRSGKPFRQAVLKVGLPTFML
jgi:hypothetical protein